MDYYRSSFYCTFLILLFASIVSPGKKDKIVNIIACTCYLFIIFCPENTRNIRYLDWAITTPILLAIYFEEIDGELPKLFPLIVCVDLAMISCGYIGGSFFYVGLLFYLMLMWLIYRDSFLFWSFSVVWGMYGVAFMIPNTTTKNMTYNLLDILSKAAFSALLQKEKNMFQLPDEPP